MPSRRRLQRSAPFPDSPSERLPTASPAVRNDPVCWRTSRRIVSENIPDGRRPRSELTSSRAKRQRPPSRFRIAGANLSAKERASWRIVGPSQPGLKPASQRVGSQTAILGHEKSLSRGRCSEPFCDLVNGLGSHRAGRSARDEAHPEFLGVLRTGRVCDSSARLRPQCAADFATGCAPGKLLRKVHCIPKFSWTNSVGW
jgi:hypothetical protein